MTKNRTVTVETEIRGRITAMDTASPTYRAGFAMGVRHARTGDPADVSDARCLPLEAEARAAEDTFLSLVARGQFARGYDDGYDWAIAHPGEDCPDD